MENDLKEQIRKALTLQDQTTIFYSGVEDDLEEACAAFLKFKGYRVINPTDYKYNIRNITDLASFFYAMLDSRHPEYINVYRNLGRDRKIASLFVRNRMETTGNSKEIALKECAAIIDTVFKYEKKFKFRTDIYFGMFGQANLSWVTRRAVELMNKKTDDVRREKSRKDVERIEHEQQAEYDLGFNNIDSILARIEGEENGE